MNWEIAGITFAFMIVGYFIGSILNVVWITKYLKIDDVRKHGSGNAGSTNALRVHGKTLGLAVFFLDLIKPLVAVLIAFYSVGPEKVVVQAVALSVLIGHIFPIYYKFKGGKGAATMAGMFLVLSWPIFFIGLAVMTIVLLITKKVSIGSLVTPIIAIIFYTGFIYISGYRGIEFEPYTSTYPATINIVAFILALLFVIFAHYKNIIRLSKGKEKRIKAAPDILRNKAVK